MVSVPCLDWFEAQDAAYIESVLPAAVTARVSVEAGIAQPWWRWLGAAGRPVSLEHYGASADYTTIYEQFGVTAEAVAKAARESLSAAEALGGRGAGVFARPVGPVGPADNSDAPSR